jgi:4-hydroxy-2-oxoheptanedioate aldolase
MPGKLKIAFWLETDSQHACEIAAQVGYDIVILDMEHGVCTSRDADRLIPFCKRLGLTVYSRVAEPERAPIQHALDAGADGVILPQVRDAAHAAAVSAYAKFPPDGSRGVGFSRIMDYGGTPKTWPEKQNAATVCYAQVETVGALQEAAEIAALPTVDGLFLGPSDLSMARGRGPNRWTKADVDDLNRVARAAKKAGKLFATTGAENAKSRQAGLAAGADFLTAGDDLSALMAGFDQIMRAAKGR